MKKNPLSLNIKKLRMFKNMSQEEFSSIFDVKRGTLGSYEEGRAEPKLEFLIKLADYFKLTIDEIVRKELTVNQIAHFPELKGDTESKSLKELSKEISNLSQKIGRLELKISTQQKKK